MTSEDEGLPDDEQPMTMVEHLAELRMRLMYSIVVMAIAVGICFYYAEYIYQFLAQPLADAMSGMEEGRSTNRLIYTNLTEPFFTYMKVSLWAGFFISFPFISAQVWMYLAPALYKQEKRAFFPFLIFTPILFVLGAAMAYYVVFPLAWDFFLSFERPMGAAGLAIQLEAKVNEYLSLVMKLILAFGICFELPVLLTLLAKVGIVTSRGLAAKRKYAIVITLLVAAFMTPPDLISQILLAIPVLILYEISIILARIVEKKKLKDA